MVLSCVRPVSIFRQLVPVILPLRLLPSYQRHRRRLPADWLISTVHMTPSLAPQAPSREHHSHLVSSLRVYSALTILSLQGFSHLDKARRTVKNNVVDVLNSTVVLRVLRMSWELHHVTVFKTQLLTIFTTFNVTSFA